VQNKVRFEKNVFAILLFRSQAWEKLQKPWLFKNIQNLDNLNNHENTRWLSGERQKKKQIPWFSYWAETITEICNLKPVYNRNNLGNNFL